MSTQHTPEEVATFLREIDEHNEAIASSRPPTNGDDLGGDTIDDAVPTRPPRPDDRKVVLLIEDETDVREILRDMLEDNGYRVKEATNGEEALKLLDREYTIGQYTGNLVKPDVILLDIWMPVMSGLEFYGQVKHFRPNFRDIPILVMSAGENLPNFGWAVNVNHLDTPAALIKKPFEFDALLEKVRRAIEEGSPAGTPTTRH